MAAIGAVGSSGKVDSGSGDIGWRCRESRVELSAAHSHFFDLGLCPLPCEGPVEQQRGMICVMLNDIEGMCRKH